MPTAFAHYPRRELTWMRRHRAFNLIRRELHYRRDAFDVGLKSCGFDIHDGRAGGEPQPGDILVTWNRYGFADSLARRFEQIGAPVIIAENGYIGLTENPYAKPFATKEQTPDSHLYAMALNGHNGSGHWPVGEPGRWRDHGIVPQPWRKGGRHLLVLPQRGIGPAGTAMPGDWVRETVRGLQAATRRPVRVRQHPGNAPATMPLADDLEGCWAAVTWASGAAIKALCAGVPVFYGFKRWIGAPGALPLGSDIEKPLRDDAAREWMLDRLAWAQWTVAEITTGEPFRRLLAMHHERAKAA